MKKLVGFNEKKSEKCKWCKTPIKVSHKLYCNNSCKEKYRYKKIKTDPKLLAKKKERDQKYRDNLSKKKKEKRKVKDKIYAKERWKNTISDPAKLEAKRTYDKKWQFIEYWENKKIILVRRKFLRNKHKVLEK